MKLFKKAKRGFTLVELVVVIAVIAILAAVSVGAYFGVTESANKSKLEQESRQFYTAIQTTALVPSDNYTLNADGLTVKDIDQFEEALEYTMGQDIEVLNSEPIYVAKQTIVLKTTDFYAQNGGTLYKTFEYYTPEVSGKKIAVNVVNGDYYHYNTNVVVNNSGVDVTNDTILFKAPQFQDEVYIYAWAGTGDSKIENNSWPGMQMNTYVSALDLYAYDVPSNYENIVFNWRQFERNEDNSIKYDTDGNPLIVDANKPDEHKTEDISLKDRSSNTNYYIFDQKGWKETPIIKDAKTAGKTVSINEWRNEEKLYAYAFNFNSEKNAPWPGVEMEIDELRSDRLATYRFDKDYCVVIFNNGNNEDSSKNKQTGNIFLTDALNDNGEFGENMFYDIKNGKWENTLPYDTFISPESVGIIGSASDWKIEVPFNSDLQGKIWTYEDVLLENEEFKIKIDHSWDRAIDYEKAKNMLSSLGEFFSEGTNKNLKTKKDGYYSITYNAVRKTLIIVQRDLTESDIKEEILPTSISMVGSFKGEDRWSDDNFFQTEDRKIWTLSNVELHELDEFKLRTNELGDNWIGAGQLDQETKSSNNFTGEDNIKVATCGTYSMTYDYMNNKLSIVKESSLDEGVSTTIYLKPNSNWTQANARFAAYFFGNGETWADMNDTDEDGIYEVEVPTGYPSVIFCRMNPSITANNWNNKWNQTSDLVTPKYCNNLYTIETGTWDKGNGTRSTYVPTSANVN